MHLIHRILDWLNPYANLLLVLITAVYAFLTWRTLEAMKGSNLREQRARHLQRIKDYIVMPIQIWLQNDVPHLFSGARDVVQVIPRTTTHHSHSSAVKEPNVFAQGICEVNRLDSQLLGDALGSHFPEQLEKFISFMRTLDGLFASLLELAQEAQQEVEKDQSLPLYRGRETQSRYADSHNIIRCYLRDLVSGPTGLVLIGAPGGKGTLRYSGVIILAEAPYDDLNAWLERFKSTVNGLWQKGSFHERMKKIQRDKNGLWDAIGQIEITETLPGKCKYVSE